MLTLQQEFEKKKASFDEDERVRREVMLDYPCLVCKKKCGDHTLSELQQCNIEGSKRLASK